MPAQPGAPIAPSPELPPPAMQHPLTPQTVPVPQPAASSPAAAPIALAAEANQWVEEIAAALGGQPNPARRADMVQAVKQRYQEQVLRIVSKGRGPTA